MFSQKRERERESSFPFLSFFQKSQEFRERIPNEIHLLLHLSGEGREREREELNARTESERESVCARARRKKEQISRVVENESARERRWKNKIQEKR